MKKIDFCNMKRHIKAMCRDNVLDLCDKVGLNEYETNLILNINKNNTRIYTAMQLGVCESKVSKDNRKVITKIYDHLKRNNLDI